MNASTVHPLALERTPEVSVVSMTIRTEGGPQTAGTAPAGIADVARLSGLSQDTLRWYEREGLLPRLSRGADRRRRYTERDVAMVVMLAKLRDSGMPTEDMREFSQLVSGGAATHGQRLAILERHRARIHERMEALDDALASLEEKTTHYRHLIAEGLDCDGRPVSPDVAALQRRGISA